MQPSLSVIVLTHNEEPNIGECLESLRGLDAEVLVVDSGSSDATPDIARRHGAVVVEHPFVNYATQRNWAIDHLPMRTEWELHLDADERLTGELREEIRTAIARAPAEVDGFLVRRRTVFMGRVILHGGHYPVYHLRLFRRGRARCEARLYDQHFITPGRVERLNGDLIDTITPSLDRWIERHNRWADLEARQYFSNGQGGEVTPRLAGTPIERRRWLKKHLYGRFPLFVRPALYFAYRYFLRLGFLDGREGLIFHFLQGFWFRFLIDARIYELRKSRKR